MEEEEAVGLAPIEANIERLLQDCRQLLADADPSGEGGTVVEIPSFPGSNVSSKLVAFTPLTQP